MLCAMLAGLGKSRVPGATHVERPAVPGTGRQSEWLLQEAGPRLSVFLQDSMGKWRFPGVPDASETFVARPVKFTPKMRPETAMPSFQASSCRAKIGMAMISGLKTLEKHSPCFCTRSMPIWTFFDQRLPAICPLSSEEFTGGIHSRNSVTESRRSSARAAAGVVSAPIHNRRPPGF